MTRVWRRQVAGPNPFALYDNPGRMPLNRQATAQARSLVTQWLRGRMTDAALGRCLGRWARRWQGVGAWDTGSTDAVAHYVWAALGGLHWTRKLKRVDEVVAEMCR
jgi:hypothetical protein